jgi:hypothetical protein
MAEVRHYGASILEVITLYKMRPEVPAAYHTLQAAISRIECKHSQDTVKLQQHIADRTRLTLSAAVTRTGRKRNVSVI